MSNLLKVTRQVMLISSLKDIALLQLPTLKKRSPRKEDNFAR